MERIRKIVHEKDPYKDVGSHIEDFKTKKSSEVIGDKPVKEEILLYYQRMMDKRRRYLYQCKVSRKDFLSLFSDPWKLDSIRKCITFLEEVLDPVLIEYLEYTVSFENFFDIINKLDKNSDAVVKLERLKKNVRDAFNKRPQFPFEKGRSAAGY